MSLGNTTLWGDILPGGIAGELADGSIDTTEVIDDLLPSLHAASRSDLMFWAEADLIEWMDEALKFLARKAAVFIGRQASTLSVPATAAYPLPPQHVSTIRVAFGTKPLRPAAAVELEARDPQYESTPGDPDHWYENLLGLSTIAIAPVPYTEEFITLIYEGWPSALDGGKQQTLVAAPPPLKGYLAMSVLAEAYGREGEAESPDIAEHARARVAMYVKIFQQYYGEGQ